MFVYLQGKRGAMAKREWKQLREAKLNNNRVNKAKPTSLHRISLKFYEGGITSFLFVDETMEVQRLNNLLKILNQEIGMFRN